MADQNKPDPIVRVFEPYPGAFDSILGPENTPAPADLVERIARDQAKADQLNWDEPCLQDADNDIYCESSTCMAAFYEDHDADVVRQHYLRRARTAWETMQAYMAIDAVTQMDTDLASALGFRDPATAWAAEKIAAHRRAAAITPQPDPRDKVIAELRRVLKGWGDWYRLTDDGDNCAYLNGNAWPDAQALADMTMTVLAKSEGR